MTDSVFKVYDPTLIQFNIIDILNFEIKINSKDGKKVDVYDMELRAKYSPLSPYEVKSSFKIIVLEMCSQS